MGVDRILLVLVALCVCDVTQARDFTPAPSRLKRQVYSGGYPRGNYGGYPYGEVSPYSVNPYSYNPGYGYPYSGGYYGQPLQTSGYNYPYGSNLGGDAYPYSTGYSGYPYGSSYY